MTLFQRSGLQVLLIGILFSPLLSIADAQALQQASGADSDTLRTSLPALIELAEAHSKSIAQSTLEVQQATIAIQQKRMDLLPTISLRGSASYATNMPIYEKGIFHKPAQHDVIHYLYDSGADFYLNLYNGHRDLMLIKQQKMRAAVAEIQHLSTKAEVKMQVSHLFLDLTRLYQQEQLISADLHDQREQLREIQQLYTSGVVLHSDVLRIELELSKREMLSASISNDIAWSTQQLQFLTGVTAVLVPAVDELDCPLLSYEELWASAKEHAFSLRRSHQEVRLRALAIKQARSAYLPEVALTGSFTFANPQIFLYPYNDSWYSLGMVGLTVKIPVSALYKNKHVVGQALVAHEQEQVKHHQEEELLQTQLWRAFLDYQLALKEYGVCTKNVVLAQENARIIKNRYFQSTALVTDLLDADMQHLKTLFERETAKIAIQKQYYFIAFLTGSI